MSESERLRCGDAVGAARIHEPRHPARPFSFAPNAVALYREIEAFLAENL